MKSKIRNESQYKAAMLLEGALTGDRADTNAFFEALSTSDLPSQLEPAINKKVLDAYRGALGDWTKIARREIADDFRLQEIARMRFTDDKIAETNAGKAFVSGGLPKVGELDEYPLVGLGATGFNYRIGKSGVKAALSWETIINTRSLSLLEKFWLDFGQRAAKQEVYEAVSQFVDASGFTANITGNQGTNPSLLTGNPALTLDAIQDAIEKTATHTIDGQTAALGGSYILAVPQSLAPRAAEILSIREVRRVVSGDTFIQGNPLSGVVEIAVLPEITQINAGAGAFWWVQPRPEALPVANAQVAFLRGHEAPEVFIKSTTVQNPELGDFDHDAYETKVRHTATGAFTERVGIVASNGSGT